jgi:hypothetical protein
MLLTRWPLHARFFAYPTHSGTSISTHLCEDTSQIVNLIHYEFVILPQDEAFICLP